jgi:hypothetical protein
VNVSNICFEECMFVRDNCGMHFGALCEGLPRCGNYIPPDITSSATSSVSAGPTNEELTSTSGGNTGICYYPL